MRKVIWILLIAVTMLSAGDEEKKKSGFNLENFDKSIRAQDDFYRYVNGKWLETTEIPADKSNYGSFTELFDESQKNQRKIIDAAAASKDRKHGSEAQKIGDFYQSYMDTVTIEKLGKKPLIAEFEKLRQVKSRADLIKYMAYAQMNSISKPFAFFVNQDFKNATEYIGYLTQSGLGLPDKRYYEDESDKFKETREKYLGHIERMFALAGLEDDSASAALILEMETALAGAQWSRTENRDRNKTYNKFTLRELQKTTPNFNWFAFMEAAEIPSKEVVVRQPSYLEAFDSIFGQYSVDDWKTYFTWHILTGAATLLNQSFVDEDFDFYSRTLRGVQEQQPRWKRAVNATNGVLGEAVGKLYVAEHFKPEAKERMVELVANVKKAFAEQIKTLEWMDAETKTAALEKLSKFNTKIGYTDKWKDYSELEIKDNELVKNYKRYSKFRYHEMVNKLGKPIDRTEWFMTPQTVNAYYNPPMNEIVFPAAILQPPFFNMEADDAVNYGAIGAVIGHELTHGFDDQGRKSDGDGNLRDWWSEQDGQEFKSRAQVMIDQYSQYNPVDSMFVNGSLTIGENIADLGGLTIAYRAYLASLAGNAAPEINGYTGEQRFFIGWSQVWRRKYRDDALRNQLVTGPHSPSEYRVIGVLSNMPEFYKAFDVKKGDKMYRPEEIRVKIW